MPEPFKNCSSAWPPMQETDTIRIPQTSLPVYNSPHERHSAWLDIANYLREVIPKTTEVKHWETFYSRLNQ